MPNNLRTGLLAGAGLLIAVIVVNASLCYRQINELHEDSSWVTHSQDVINSVEELVSLLTDAETGQRGFLLTGKEEYLEPYNSGSASALEAVDRFGRLTTDNPEHQQRLPQLELLAKERLAILAHIIAVRREKGLEAAQAEIAKGDGKTTMDQVRALGDSIKQDELKLLNLRRETNERAYRRAVWNCIVGSPGTELEFAL